MTLPLFTLAVIMGLMLAESQLSRRHEAELRARGAIAPQGDVYAVMSVLYPVVFIIMGLEGALGPGPGAFFASGLLLFVASKALKYWAIGTLGMRWTFRVLVLPGVPLVTTGPYRYVAHPNYIAVVGELVGAAMMMNARLSGPVALAAFGTTLWVRIRFENRLLTGDARPVDRS
jgi:methyltransferase